MNKKGIVRANAGFSLLEVTITMVLLAVAGGAVVSAIISNIMAGKVNRETALAHESCRRNMEQVQSIAFGDIFATFNADPADDPGGLGLGRGNSFVPPGMDPVTGDPDGIVGLIEFPTVSDGSVEQLREDVVDPDLGMPRDLNLDGIIDAADHSGDYAILPIRVRVDFAGVTGSRTYDIVTTLSVL
jgi:prepilin-type N-terminal cleavage/methylation domain-containing protein